MKKYESDNYKLYNEENIDVSLDAPPLEFTYMNIHSIEGFVNRFVK